MKKLKYVALMVIMMMVTVLVVNDVYADTMHDTDAGIEIDGFCAFYYPGDTIEVDIKFMEDYYTHFDGEKKITDFDIMLAGGTKNKGGVLEMIPVLNGAVWSEKQRSIYYIQQTISSEKLKFIGGEHLAKYVRKIDENYLDYVKEETDENYDFGLEDKAGNHITVYGKYYLEDGTTMEVESSEISLPIIPYVSGDFNLDKDVDFFDITQLISTVYETGTETLGWRNKEAVTTNTKEYTSDENYNHRTAELGFIDIIYLIKEVYE